MCMNQSHFLFYPTKMQSILILAILAVTFSCTLALDVALNQNWKLWKDANNKRYFDAEEYVRRDIWENNFKKVQEHNLRADLGVHTYWLGMNKFADMTIDEFVKLMNGYNVRTREDHSQHRHTFTHDPNLELPDTVDWRKKGCVTPIKDAGQCAAGWAFSATGSIEGQYCIETGKLVSLSEEQLTDCSGMGCNGGIVEFAFAYINKTGGIEAESSYPPVPPGDCQFDPTKVAVKVDGYTDIKSKDENALQQAVATVGPISVAIDASHSSFQLYKRGIYNELRCSQTQLDHDVLVVGYGTDSGTAYWLVKNSWGTAWGDQGYIMMIRNKNNQCGIATDACYPLVEK